MLTYVRREGIQSERWEGTAPLGTRFCLIYEAYFATMILSGRDEMVKRITCRVVRSIPLGESKERIRRSSQSSHNQGNVRNGCHWDVRFYQPDSPVTDCKFEDEVYRAAIYASRSGGVKLSFDQEGAGQTFDCYA